MHGAAGPQGTVAAEAAVVGMTGAAADTGHALLLGAAGTGTVLSIPSIPLHGGAVAAGHPHTDQRSSAAAPNTGFMKIDQSFVPSILMIILQFPSDILFSLNLFSSASENLKKFTKARRSVCHVAKQCSGTA